MGLVTEDGIKSEQVKHDYEILNQANALLAAVFVLTKILNQDVELMKGRIENFQRIQKRGQSCRT